MALEGFKNRILGSIGLLKGKKKVDEESVKDLSRSLRRALLEADFNVRQTKEITERITVQDETKTRSKAEEKNLRTEEGCCYGT